MTQTHSEVKLQGMVSFQLCCKRFLLPLLLALFWEEEAATAVQIDIMLMLLVGACRTVRNLRLANIT